ncbi:TPA: glycosyl transferase, partial [Escherichia coli]
MNKSIDVIGGYCTEFGSEFALKVKKVPLEHNDIVNYSALRCPFIHPTVMFRSRVFDSNIRYPVNTYYSEDLALWYILLANGYKFANIPEILLKYRITEDTLFRRKGF